jgi:hypothetical protein
MGLNMLTYLTLRFFAPFRLGWPYVR